MRLAALFAAVCVVGEGIRAQEILWQRTGVPNQTSLTGWAVYVGDLNGDGWSDVAQYGLEQVGAKTEPRLFYLSGSDGTSLRTFRVPTSLVGVSALAAAGDMDGDGMRDYIVTVESMQVRSGRDDSLIWEVSGPKWSGFGDVVVGDLDVDGDGWPDVVVGAPQEGSGQIYAFDNAGTQLYKVPRMMWGEMGRVGDINNDACDDFVVAGPDATTNAQSAFVLSGKTGQVLLKGEGLPGEGLGSAMSIGCGGDVNGDGVLDFASSSNGGFGQTGVVRVFSGATGDTLYVWKRPLGGGFGRWLSAGDLDRDSVPDLLVGSGEIVQNTGGRIYWYSLRDGSEVMQLYPPGLPNYTTAFGSAMFVGPEQPGSPFPVFTTSEPRYFQPGSWVFPGDGRITMWRSAPSGVTSLGPACVGTLPSAPQIGLTDLGQAGVRIHLSNGPPSSLAFLILGLSSTSWGAVQLPLALGSLGLPGCNLYTSVEIPVRTTTGASGLNSGYALFDLPIPLGSSVSTVNGQWMVLGAGGGALSDALSWQH